MATLSNEHRSSSSTTSLELTPQMPRVPLSASELELSAPYGESENELEPLILHSSSLLASDNQPLDHISVNDAKNWKRERLYIAACCGCLFLTGWNDGSTGPLLPTIQKHYQAWVSLRSLACTLLSFRDPAQFHRRFLALHP